MIANNTRESIIRLIRMLERVTTHSSAWLLGVVNREMLTTIGFGD